MALNNNGNFVVVEYKKCGKLEIEAVPNAWIINNRVYWPPSNLTEMIKIPWLTPEITKWTSHSCKIKRAGFDKFEDAFNKVTEMMDTSPTEESDNIDSERAVTRNRRHLPVTSKASTKSFMYPTFNIPPVNILCKLI